MIIKRIFLFFLNRLPFFESNAEIGYSDKSVKIEAESLLYILAGATVQFSTGQLSGHTPDVT